MAGVEGSTGKILVIVLAVVMMIAAAFSYALFVNGPSATDNNDSSPIVGIDDSIQIYGDDELEDYAANHSLLGNGTEENPFIIQNLSIVIEGICIDIRDVGAFFVIRNCSLRSIGSYTWIVLYLRNCSGAVIENCSVEGDLSGIEFFDCCNVTVENCYVSASVFGINSSLSQHSIIRQNTVSNCTWGISVVGSNETRIERNEIMQNELGLMSQFCFDCVFIECNMTNNGLGAHIDVRCQNWLIYSNRFIGNTAGNALDDGSMNNWDDGVSIGNIWDDYSGTGTYSIPGSAGSCDHFPQSP